ncbi:hypothetical protein GAY28_00370 [Azospirillum brasilense]|nr:hypothetical protein [Azospirillum brasilense]
MAPCFAAAFLAYLAGMVGVIQPPVSIISTNDPLSVDPHHYVSLQAEAFRTEPHRIAPTQDNQDRQDSQDIQTASPVVIAISTDTCCAGAEGNRRPLALSMMPFGLPEDTQSEWANTRAEPTNLPTAANKV